MKSNPPNTELSRFTSREASFFQSPSKMHRKLLPAFSDGPHPSVKVFRKTNYSEKVRHTISSIIVRAYLVLVISVRLGLSKEGDRTILVPPHVVSIVLSSSRISSSVTVTMAVAMAVTMAVAVCVNTGHFRLGMVDPSSERLDRVPDMFDFVELSLQGINLGYDTPHPSDFSVRVLNHIPCAVVARLD